MSLDTSPTKTRRDLKSVVAPLLPQIAEDARATERNAVVNQAHVDALNASGYFDALKPRAFGGTGHRYAEVMDATMDISAACGSTGWVVAQIAVHQWLLGCFPLQAQKDVWDGGDKPLICASYAPAAMAVPEAGGYRLTGDWHFASGCENTTWAFCSAMIPQGEGQPPKPAFCLVPQSDYTITGVWDTVGLAGTGSKTIHIEDQFVPEHRLLFFADVLSGNSPGAAAHADEPIFRMPLLSCVPSSLAQAGIGAAQGGLDSYIASVSHRVTRGAVAGGKSKMAEFPTIQVRVAEAAAAVDAAREILLRDLERVQSKVEQGGTFDLDDRLRNRRGQAFSVSLSVRASELLNASTGGQGLTMDNKVQRAWRDVNAVSRHISMNWDTVATMIGQHLLGLDPQGQF